jgi:drug/metabolite transporter (DMT)-like permease
MGTGPSAPTAPRLLLVTGALCLSGSVIFVKLADVDFATAAFLRCAIALVVLVPFALAERRRHARRTRHCSATASPAGLCLGIDYSMWTAGILDVGAGIATVLVNVQVLAFPLLAGVFDGTAIGRRFLLSSVLAPNTSATLLLLQPVMAVVLPLAILRETPTGTQLAGCAVVIAAVWFANRRPPRTSPHAGRRIRP